MMRKFGILFALLMSFQAFLFAQDTIFLVDGTQITGRVTEVDLKVIHYVPGNGSDGSIVTLKKENIEKIHYENGYEEIYQSAPFPKKPEVSARSVKEKPSKPTKTKIKKPKKSVDNATSSSEKSTKIRISLFAGTSASLTRGEPISNYRADLKDFNVGIGNNYTVSSGILPRINPLLGIRGGLEIMEKLVVGTGLEFVQRGFQSKLKYTYRDPNIQYDETYIFKSNTWVGVFEIPIWASWELTEKAKIQAGFTVGFAPNGMAGTKGSLERELITNGEIDQQNSEIQKDDIQRLLKSDVKNSPFGLFLAASYQLGQKINAELRLQNVNNYLLIEEGISSLNIGLSLHYSLPNSLFSKK